MASKAGEIAGVTQSAAGRCPICRKPADYTHRPFCSRRCADIDLARWLSGSYAIAGSADDGAVRDDDGRLKGEDRRQPDDDLVDP
jgi:hypothetical protein